MFVGCKAFDALMNANIKLLPNQGEILDDPSRYRRLVGKLNYLAVTRSDIAFIISVVSQFLSASRITDWNVVVWILMYLKKLRSRLLYLNCGHTRVVSQMQIG